MNIDDELEQFNGEMMTCRRRAAVYGLGIAIVCLAALFGVMYCVFLLDSSIGM